MPYTLPSYAIPNNSLPNFAIPYSISPSPPSPPSPPTPTTTIDLLYTDIANYSTLAYLYLNSYTSYIADAIAYTATIQNVQAKLDIYNTVLASRNNTDLENKLNTLYGYAKLMNNLILQRYNYTDINDFLDEYSIQVSEAWADFSARDGVIIDPVHII